MLRQNNKGRSTKDVQVVVHVVLQTEERSKHFEGLVARDAWRSTRTSLKRTVGDDTILWLARDL